MNRAKRKAVLGYLFGEPSPEPPTPGGETLAQRRFVARAGIEPSAGPGWCLAWVCNVYQNSIGAPIRRETAYMDWLATTTYNNRNIPKGAVVYGTGRNSNGAGHIGIYLGNGKVRDNQERDGAGVVVTSDLDEWLSWQTDIIGGRRGYLGWGWFNNVNLNLLNV